MKLFQKEWDFSLYLGNASFYQSLADQLEMRVASQEEQKLIIETLPWNDIAEKFSHANIPFSGCYNFRQHEFSDIGSLAFLRSSTPTDTKNTYRTMVCGYNYEEPLWQFTTSGDDFSLAFLIRAKS
jgi:hypothetical protein